MDGPFSWVERREEDSCLDVLGVVPPVFGLDSERLGNAGVETSRGLCGDRIVSTIAPFSSRLYLGVGNRAGETFSFCA
jgi:hypothetical protein